MENCTVCNRGFEPSDPKRHRLMMGHTAVAAEKHEYWATDGKPPYTPQPGDAARNRARVLTHLRAALELSNLDENLASQRDGTYGDIVTAIERLDPGSCEHWAETDEWLDDEVDDREADTHGMEDR